MTSPVRLARTAGAYHLAIAKLGGFAHGYLRAGGYVPGDAAPGASDCS